MTVHTRKAAATILGGHKRSGMQLVAEQLKVRAFERKEALIRKRRAALMAKASRPR
jgi:hypothetical protein